MNIIVVGLGKVGIKLVERLSKEEYINITAVDLSKNKTESVVNAYDVMGVIGSGTSIDILLDAGVKEADVLIVAITSSITSIALRRPSIIWSLSLIFFKSYSKARV